MGQDVWVGGTEIGDNYVVPGWIADDSDSLSASAIVVEVAIDVVKRPRRFRMVEGRGRSCATPNLCQGYHRDCSPRALGYPNVATNPFTFVSVTNANKSGNDVK